MKTKANPSAQRMSAAASGGMVCLAVAPIADLVR